MNRALILILSISLLPLVCGTGIAGTQNPVGEWTFDDPDSLLAATTGNALELVGNHVAVDGPEPDDGAIVIGVGSFYRCFHDIPANGDRASDRVNRFTLAMDLRVPQLGDRHCFYQTSYLNDDDGDGFVNAEGGIGVDDTGYSSYTMIPGEWYRLAVSVDLGRHFDYYLDGQHLHDGGAQILDGRFALYSAESANEVLFFADEDGEDWPIDVARIQLYDGDLSAAEIADLGGYGHVVAEPAEHEMEPYLQSPTATSIHINWHGASGSQSLVEYGQDLQLGQQAFGETISFDGRTVWHHTALDGLSPDTEYFYCCVTDTARSDTLRFRSQPADEVDDGHIRFVVYGDSRATPAMHALVVQSFRSKVAELYGDDVHSQLDAVLSVGDIVTTGSVLSQYRDEYLGPISTISSEVPFMVSIGNHEAEADLYYDYMNYEEFAGPEGELYYAFRIGPARFIALNSNTRGNTQLDWLAAEMAAAQADGTTDWVFVYTHHPGHSELWPDGGMSWIQDQVIPLLAQHEKAAGLFFGHSHNYERGIVPGSDLRLLLSGGGGCSLDRWGMFGNQMDYPEIHRAHDYYCYVIYDIDCANRSYSANAYSLGHGDRPMDNELFDSFSRELDLARPSAPTALSPIVDGLVSPCLTASPYTGERPIMSSRFQIRTADGDWNAVLKDSIRHWENIHGDTGSPDWLPVDLNAAIDLARLQLSPGTLTLGESYLWRTRYRDRNLGWSNWSAPKGFTTADLPLAADFHGEPREGEPPLAVRFTDLSRGEPLSWNWDLDGDGTTDSQERDPVWIYEEDGDWTVTLSVDYGAEQSTEIKEGYISVSTVTSVGEADESASQLMQCRPNPFNPSTEITFTLARRESVRLSLFDLRGRRVRRLLETVLPAGAHRRNWNGRDDHGSPLSSGLYLIRLQIADEVQTRKVLLIK